MPTAENIKTASKNYNPADKDFQHTEEDVDDVSNLKKKNWKKGNSAFIRQVQHQIKIM